MKCSAKWSRYCSKKSEMGVIQCENAEAALAVLEKMGALLSMMFTDVNLTGLVFSVTGA